MSAHRRGIGGTDAGPVVAYFKPDLAPSLAKYANATDVAMRLIYGIERTRTAVMSRGLDAEPRLRTAYLDAYGARLVERPEKWIVQHPRFPWATCSPDDVAIPAESLPAAMRPIAGTAPADDWLRDHGINPRVLVEYKSTSSFALYPPPNAKDRESKWGDPDTDVVPPVYALQCQWNMEILDLDVCHLFAGFGRDFVENDVPTFLYSETRRYVIRRDRELAAMALDYCARFQADFIECRKLPPLAPVNNKRAYSQLLKGSHPCQQSKPSEATEAPSPSSSP